MNLRLLTGDTADTQIWKGFMLNLVDQWLSKPFSAQTSKTFPSGGADAMLQM